MSSMEHDNAKAAAVATHPRVDLKDIEARISEEYTFNVGRAVSRLDGQPTPHGSLNVLTMCIIVMDNGFSVVGKSAPASPENFDSTLGRVLARDDAIRQLWPLMGFELRTSLMKGQTA